MKTVMILTLAFLLAFGNIFFLLPHQTSTAQTAPVINDQSLPNVFENTASSSFVGTVMANDADPGDKLTYSIEEGNTDNAFTIDSNNGDVTVNNSNALDYETNPVFNLVVEVVDSGTTPLSDDAVVTINLDDENEAPVVDNGTMGIDENSPNGSIVGTVASSDPEGNITGFTIDPDTVFSIDASGQITVADQNQLDYETTTQYIVTVEATDSGALTDDATITIDVNNVNDNDPIITNPNPTFNIDENSLDGTVVGTITATDPDEDTLSFSIIAGDTAGVFAISNSGTITVADGSQLNYESTTQYDLTVEVDDGVHNDTANVTIDVNDVNDPPVASNDTASATEDGAPVGLQVPAATDEDNNLDTNGYALATDVSEGNLTFNSDGTYTFDPGSNFQDLRQGATHDEPFTYTASDTGAGLSDPATVTITITGVNDPPTDITLDNNSVAEHQASGTVVGTFSTTDLDTGDDYIYTLVDGTGDGSNSLFDTDGENLITNTVFDYESGSPTHNIRVETYDGVERHEKEFVINIIDVNDPPTDITLSGSTVVENTASGSVVGTFTTTDPNPDIFTYSLVAGTGDEDNESFKIVGNELQTKEEIDYETNPTCSIRVQTDDGNGNTYTEAFTITVTNVNEAPTAINDNYSVIRGNTLTVPSTGIDDILENDTDPENDYLTPILVGGSPSHAATFSFDGGGGFTYEHDGSLTPTIVEFSYYANDGTQDSDSPATVTITIADPGTPTITSPTATDITQNSAKLGSTVVTNGGTQITSMGVVWSSSSGSGSATTSAGIGTFTVSIPGLDAGTTYHYRGFATNSIGTSYTAEDTSFETDPELSNVSGSPTSVNEGSSFTLSGNITAASETKLTIDWGDDSSNTVDDDPGTSFSESHTYEEGNDSHTITVTLALDSDATQNDTVEKQVTVKDVSPEVSITGSSAEIDEGDTFTLTIGKATDPGDDTITKYRVYWDGTFTVYNDYDTDGSTALSKTHVYNSPSTSAGHPISVSITDDDGTHQKISAVTVKVNNVEPTAQSHTYSTREDTPLSIGSSGGLLKNSNSSFDTLKVRNPGQITAIIGEITVQDDGSFTYNPNGKFNNLETGDTAIDTFLYTVEDDEGSTDTATVTITITGYTPGSNDPPPLPIYFLHVTTDPQVGGTVTLNPPGGSYVEGTVVTLTASPAQDYSFSGWEGALTGSANPETITINSNKSATAKFAFMGTPVATGTPSVGTPTQTGTPTGNSEGGGMNLWIVMGPLLGVGAIVALSRIQTMGGFSRLRKLWTMSKANYE